MLGRSVAMPVALAPTGLAGMVHPNGEVLAAQAAEKFGVPFTLSTMSICSIEDIAAATSHPFWFQLYVMRDKELVANLIDRAKAANCSALVVTVDLAVQGRRYKDVRNSLSMPPKFTPRQIYQMALCPRWCLGMLGTRRRTLGNIVGHAKGVDSTSALSTWEGGWIDQKLSWKDLAGIRDRWGGPLILKGILDGDDAAKAIEIGADAIVVSNHGGRQLDGAPSSIRVLPEIVSIAGNKMEVYLDSGIRSGQDVLKAMCLGAKGALIGRAFLYGLGAMGKPGVSFVLETIRKELDETLALCGKRSVLEADREMLYSYSL